MNKDLQKLLGKNGQTADGLLQDLEAKLDAMEEELLTLARCGNEALAEDLHRVIASGGKRLRPVLAYLGYRAGKEDAAGADSSYPDVPLMTAMELIHTSSLIHDDIVDRADVRRSVPTINATSGNYRAVQAGDYLLAEAGRMAKDYQGLQFDRHFAFTAKEMCVAEFMQMEFRNVFDDHTLEHYYEQIRRKTAGLIASSVSMGAVAGGASEKTVSCLEQYGIHTGLAFQIRDDVLDFASGSEFGKKCGKDIEQGIFTLPLILALTEEGTEEIRMIAVKEEKTEEDIRRIVEFVKASDAVSKAQEEIINHTDRAADAIGPIADGEVKEALLALAGGLAVRNV